MLLIFLLKSHYLINLGMQKTEARRWFDSRIMCIFSYQPSACFFLSADFFSFKIKSKQIKNFLSVLNSLDPDLAWPWGYKPFFIQVLNSAEHEIFLLINVKMPTIVGILIFISRINTPSERFKAKNFLIFVSILVFMSRKRFMLIWVEHEKSFITSRPDLSPKCLFRLSNNDTGK